MNSAHEGYAVLAEEVDEVWDEVRKREHVKVALLREVVQVGAMAQRMAEDLGLLSDQDHGEAPAVNVADTLASACGLGCNQAQHVRSIIERALMTGKR